MTTAAERLQHALGYFGVIGGNISVGAEYLRTILTELEQFKQERDELVEKLKYFVECEAESLSVEHGLRHQYPHIQKSYDSEMEAVHDARSLLAKINGGQGDE